MWYLFRSYIITDGWSDSSPEYGILARLAHARDGELFARQIVLEGGRILLAGDARILLDGRSARHPEHGLGDLLKERVEGVRLV
jgi:hypothetical protein